MKQIALLLTLLAVCSFLLAEDAKSGATWKKAKKEVKKHVQQTPPPENNQPARKVGVNAFGVSLYQELAAKEGNVFFSPASIHTALTMTYAGARNQTAEQIASAMQYPSEPNGEAFFKNYGRFLAELTPAEKADYRLDIANALWIQENYNILPEFLKINKDTFHAGLFPLDFITQPDPSRLKINAWVAEQTQKKIKDLLPAPAVTPDTRMVLTNAVYFKAEWIKQFKKRATSDRPFYPAEGEQTQVPTMHQTARFDYAEDDKAQVLKMDYRGGEVAMLVVLPKQRGGLPAVEKALSVEQLIRWVNALKSQRVSVWLPKVKMDYRVELKKPLSALGMALAFSGDADFSGMTREEKLCISDVYHKAFVAIDEKGTEAAAATAVVMMRATAIPSEKPVVFRANHPYLVLLRHEKTGAILFMGRVSQP